jgi:hypothetical protein
MKIACSILFFWATTILTTSLVEGFSPRHTHRPTTDTQYHQNQIEHQRWNWRLFDVIRDDGRVAEDIDFGQGGVRLAEESAVKIVGSVKHSPGKSSPETSNLMRYTDLRQIEDGETKVKTTLERACDGARVIATGQGVELYKDPGETTVKEVYYGPMEAIKDALTNAASAMDYEELIFNFLGGNDLIAGEVYDAAAELVLMLDVATKTKISFNSLCHSSIPEATCAVTVVGFPSSGNVGSMTGVDKAVASGEVYCRDGVWYTVVEEDINTAIA